MKAKRSSRRTQNPAKQNSTNTKKSNATSSRPATHADVDPDASVLIDPRYLVEHHRMNKTAANRVAKSALDICSKRWKRAEVRLADDEINETASFIHIGYTSKIPKHDVDMEAWSDHGAWLKREIHDYLLIRACDEIGVRSPTFETAEAPNPMQRLLTLWNGAKENEEYHGLATKASWHAALLVGLRNFDCMTAAFPASKVRRARFKKLLAASLKEFLDCIPMLEQKGKRLVHDIEIGIATVIGGNSADAAEIGIGAIASVTFQDSVDAFARVYVSTLDTV